MRMRRRMDGEELFVGGESNERLSAVDVTGARTGHRAESAEHRATDTVHRPGRHFNAESEPLTMICNSARNAPAVAGSWSSTTTALPSSEQHRRRGTHHLSWVRPFATT